MGCTHRVTWKTLDLSKNGLCSVFNTEIPDILVDKLTSPRHLCLN